MTLLTTTQAERNTEMNIEGAVRVRRLWHELGLKRVGPDRATGKQIAEYEEALEIIRAADGKAVKAAEKKTHEEDN